MEKSHSHLVMGFPHGSVGKESACNGGEPGSIPGLRRSLEGGHGNSLQYFSGKNPIDRGTWQEMVPRIVKSQTRLK